MKEDKNGWVHTKWRPFMAWSYAVVCLFDFVAAPILYTIFNADPTAFANWEPLTLKAGGLYHMSMMAVVGITAYGRSFGFSTMGNNNQTQLVTNDKEE